MKLRKAICIILSVIMIVGFLPAASLNHGSGVQAATGSEIVNDALSYAVEGDWENPKQYILGYLWGGLDLNVGVDCSGFVCAIFRRHGLDLVSMNIRSSYDMYENAEKIGTIIKGNDPKSIKDGDIIITNNQGHAGIGWMNNGVPYMIHSANSRLGVVYQPLSVYLTSTKIDMIIRPNFINGVAYSNITRNSGNVSSQVNEKENLASADTNPGKPYSVPTVTITESSSKDAIMWLQTALNNVINAGLEVDGSFGPISQQAVKDFQTKYSLPVTGTADKTTIDKIVSIYKTVNSIKSVKLNKDKVNINEEQFFKFEATVTPDSAKSLPLTWSSSDQSVVLVNSEGLIVGIGGGTADVTVKTANGKTATAKVTVKAKKRSNEWYKGKWYNGDGTQTYEYTATWRSGRSGWWWGDSSGWYAHDGWQKIDNKWYYFNASGYMVYGGWQQINGAWYYLKSTGEMAEKEWVGGYWLSESGVWNYEHTARWKKDSHGWWYEDTAKWYPKDMKVKIDDVEYTFDADGYLIEEETK